MITDVKEETWGQYFKRHWTDIIFPIAFFGGWIILDFVGYSTLRPLYIWVLVLTWVIIRTIRQQKKTVARTSP